MQHFQIQENTKIDFQWDEATQSWWLCLSNEDDEKYKFLEAKNRVLGGYAKIIALLIHLRTIAIDNNSPIAIHSHRERNSTEIYLRNMIVHEKQLKAICY